MITVAAAIVRDKERVLVTQRRRDAHLGGLWEFPGGKLERGESPEQAVLRECKEECGIVVRVRDIYHVTFWKYPGRDDLLLLFYECELVEGPVRNLQVASHQWCIPSDLRDFEFPPSDHDVVTKVMSRS